MNRTILTALTLLFFGITSCVENSDATIDPQLIEKAKELNTLGE